MRWKDVAMTGVAGTLAKTAFSYLSSWKEKEQVSEPELLGTLCTGQTGRRGQVSESKEALVVGYLVHLLIGIGFAGTYHVLWRKRLARPNTVQGAWLGAVSGLLGLLGWRLLFSLHPRPPKVSLPAFLRNMLINHILFGMTAAWTYRQSQK